VRLGAKRGHELLDSLARWSVGGRSDGRSPAAAGEDASTSRSGTTRRVALRTAAGAGAVALIAPTRLLDPSKAAAATTEIAICRQKSFEKVYADFQACVKDPLEESDTMRSLLPGAEQHLETVTNPAHRRRLIRGIKKLIKRREEAINNLEFCNAVFGEDRAEGNAKCHAMHPPEGGTGGSGTGPSVGCEPGFLLCGTYCCNVEVAYCQGCGGEPTCCRDGETCCPRVEGATGRALTSN
jgi:hypothetical protein